MNDEGLELFLDAMRQSTPEFDGDTYDEERDGDRLRGQLGRVKALMLDGEWRRLDEIAVAIGGSEAGVSARLRDLRKKKFGGLTVNRRYEGGGLWEYQVLVGDREEETW